jgi:biopolymer transport protein ExbD
MITRPLDLASKLRREPRSNDWLFWVNGGLLVLFFNLFGSPWVLAPALGVEFRLPTMEGAAAEAQAATHHINVTDAGMIIVPDGRVTMDELEGWLDREMKKWKAKKASPPAVLLVFAGRGVPLQLQTQIAGAARKAGFALVCFAAEEPTGDPRRTEP